jgi:hypothetical protein
MLKNVSRQPSLKSVHCGHQRTTRKNVNPSSQMSHKPAKSILYSTTEEACFVNQDRWLWSICWSNLPSHELILCSGMLVVHDHSEPQIYEFRLRCAFPNSMERLYGHWTVVSYCTQNTMAYNAVLFQPNVTAPQLDWLWSAYVSTLHMVGIT